MKMTPKSDPMNKNTILRSIYTLLFYLGLPYAFLRLLWRSRRNPAYRERWAERLGFAPQRFEKSIWVHAVSVGEAIAALSMIKQLVAHYPNIPVVVTTLTPTGAARVQAALGTKVRHIYIPYDLPSAVRRFLGRINPVVAVIMETELWPNLFQACRERQIPILIANARLSPASAGGYKRIASLTREMLQTVHLLLSQGKADAERFIALGMPPERVVVTGNIKFDLELPSDLNQRSLVLREQLGGERLIWVAASTHGGEEEIILQAHALVRQRYPQALLILVPRHPERFNTVYELATRQGFKVARRSTGEACADSPVFLGDTMGEMMLFYAASDIAFVAGSFAQIGGHNLLEPAALSKPVLSGPVLFNFTEISELLSKADALIKVSDASSLAQAVERLFASVDERHYYGAKAKEVVESNRGALAKHLELIEAVVGAG